MTPANTDATSTEEKGELEEAFNGTASNGEDVFGFLNLPRPHGDPSASAVNATDSTRSEGSEREDGGDQEQEDARTETAAESTDDASQEVAPAVPTAVSEGLPAAIQSVLLAELPETGKPAEIITACEKRLHAALTLREAMEQRSLEAYFHYAGPAVRLAHRTDSWRHIVDPATGKPCRSWSAWLRAVKVSRQHAFRMLKVEPLMEALKGLETGPLGVRQIDVLSPVLTQHGKSKVRELWEAADATGDTSATNLARVRDQLGLAVELKPESDEEPGRTHAPVLRFQAAPGTFDEAKVREATRAQPEIARLVAKAILAELGEDPAV
ncbi:hypothetical protein [Streptomyces sp. NPDC048191]|uniref:hypothetical protein n=1 Tax=Streptomyces sp. NPDC048191 TaxID=3155484 RepID=UPI0033E5FF2B